MKHTKFLAIVLIAIFLLSACAPQVEEMPVQATNIQLEDGQILVDGSAAGSEPKNGVYIANDIVYYEDGKDFTYGEGTQAEAHSREEATAHTVVHITQPGTYSLSGKLSKGQIAVDLGEDAKEDPNAVVTLVLNGVDITCEVAPAVIFYSVYECGNTENGTKDVDTSKAGANVIIADGSENTVRGSYVARIYKPGSVVLNDDGTEVEDAKKLHKYDGAFYSKMSINVNGGKSGTGKLNIYAENEGLDSELHLTINGGNIDIFSGNDGINTNEDGISVTTMNGGLLNIRVTGETGEGDGIDSNGYLVINGGTVIAAACSNSADAGIDSDMGIHINGGTVIATGSMLDRIEDGGQTYAVFSFAQKQEGNEVVSFKDESGKTVLEHTPENGYSVLIYSGPDLKEGVYTLWSNDTQLAGQSGGMAGGPGMAPSGMMPPEGEQPEPSQGMERPNDEWPGDQEPPAGEWPGGQEPPQGEEPPERPEKPDGQGQRPEGGMPQWNGGQSGEVSTEFRISKGANMFSGIAAA